MTAITKKPVEILDPSEDVRDFIDFLENDLDYLSHFRVYNLLQWQDMFKSGEEVGDAILDHPAYRHLLEGSS